LLLQTGIGPEGLIKVKTRVAIFGGVAILLMFGSAQLGAQDVVAQDVQSAGEDEADAAAHALQLTRYLEQQRNAIMDLESNVGIYHPSLVEAYSDLGGAYEELEDYLSAVDVYTNALQVARISSGLISDAQLPVLNKLIENSQKMEDYPSTDDYYHLSYHIQSRLYEPGDEAYTAAVNEFGNWRLRVLRENLLALTSRGLYQTATNLSDFYTRNIEKIEAIAGPYSDGLLQAVYGKSVTDIEVARSIARTPYTAFQGTVSQYTTQTRCQNVRNTQGQLVRQCVNIQVENPRYRQSQRDAKRLALNRYTRAIEGSVVRMQNIVALNPDWPLEQRQEVEVRIRQLMTEYEQMEQSTRRRSLLF